jgi:hypothetical protein
VIGGETRGEHQPDPAAAFDESKSALDEDLVAIDVSIR